MCVFPPPCQTPICTPFLIQRCHGYSLTRIPYFSFWHWCRGELLGFTTKPLQLNTNQRSTESLSQICTNDSWFRTLTQSFFSRKRKDWINSDRLAGVFNCHCVISALTHVVAVCMSVTSIQLDLSPPRFVTAADYWVQDSSDAHSRSQGNHWGMTRGPLFSLATFLGKSDPEWNLSSSL